MTSSLIELDGIGLTLPGPHGPVEILRDISLTVNSAETVGLVGPSGSGKTSLLLVLAGLERASQGTVKIAGTDITRSSEDALAVFRRGRVGVVFQNFHLIPTMTAVENVAIPLELAGNTNAFAEAAAALADVGLGKRLDHYPAQLSGGEQQRVALARAFVTRPQLLLADEPTGNLDRETGEAVVALMFGLHEKYGTTLMLVTHDSSLAARCGRTVTLADGRIAASGAAAA